MFDHPFFCVTALNLVISLCRLIFDRSLKLSDFVRSFCLFPYWAALLLFCSFYVVRSIRSSYLFKLSRTLHHRLPDPPRPVVQVATGIDSTERDITSARTPPQKFHFSHV